MFEAADPLPYHVDGPDRPGRWLVTCDHASNRVPKWVAGGDLGIPAADMGRHIAWDVGAAGVARALGRLLDSPVILSDFSRLVIDPNRGEDDPTLVMQLYDGRSSRRTGTCRPWGSKSGWTVFTAPITPPMPAWRRCAPTG